MRSLSDSTGFFSFLGLTRLTSEKVVVKAIATGVEKRIFGYIGGGAPTLGSGLDCDTDTRFGGVLGDGCVDTEDANPNDPWDFYSVPVPALVAASNPMTTFRDNAVTPFDAQAVWRYFIGGASAGMPIYEQDLNGNGVYDAGEPGGPRPNDPNL